MLHRSPVSVLHTVASLDEVTGGPARSIPLLCRYLAKRGHSISIASSVIPDVYERRYPEIENILRLPRSGHVSEFLLSGIENQLIKFLEKTEVHLIHDHGAWLSNNRSASKAAKRQRIQFAISTRGMLMPKALAFRAWKKKLAMQAFQLNALSAAACVFATSEMEAIGLRDLRIRTPIALVPNGVEIPPAVNQDHQGKTTAREVLFLSRLHPNKGLHTLIRAWERLRPNSWILRIVGPMQDAYAAEMRRLVSDLNLNDRVFFQDMVSDEAKWGIYQRAELFVLPTLTENFGNAIGEALASGIPVITTRGAPWAQIESENAGWWIKNDLRELTACLEVALSLSPEELAAMGARGRSMIQREFSWEVVAEKTEHAYNWLLGRGDRPDFVELN